MPIYDFYCPCCKKRWEDLLRYNEKSPCPGCQKPGQRLLPQHIVTRYHGKGFYSTDYKK